MKSPCYLNSKNQSKETQTLTQKIRILSTSPFNISVFSGIIENLAYSVKKS